MGRCGTKAGSEGWAYFHTLHIAKHLVLVPGSISISSSSVVAPNYISHHYSIISGLQITRTMKERQLAPAPSEHEAVCDLFGFEHNLASSSPSETP